jgi:hypothetical protein
VLVDFLPLEISQLNLHLPELEKALQRPVSFAEVQEWLEEFAQQGRLQKQEGPFGPTYLAVRS